MGVNLSGLINAGTQALGTYEQSKAQAGQQQIGAIMQAIAMQRQQAKDDLAQAVAQSTIGKNSATVAHLGAQTSAAQHPLIPIKTITGADNRISVIPTKLPDGSTSISPIATGISAAPRPTRIDPNSPEGIAAAGQRADAAAKARADHAVPRQAPSEPLVKTVGPDGTPIYTPRGQAAGMGVPSTAAQGAGAGAMSGQTMQTMARMGTSYNDLKQAIDQMDQYENTPGNLAKQTAGKQALGAMSEVHPSQDAHGLMGALNNGLGALVGAKAGEKIGQDDPEYRTYLNNKQRVATAFTELLPRPNQALLQLEKGLSGADVSWNPTLIRNIQARRRGGLDVLKNILGSQGMLDGQGNMTGTPAGGGRGGAPPNVAHPAGKDPGGSVNLGGTPAVAKAAAKKDYGIFTPPGDE